MSPRAAERTWRRPGSSVTDANSSVRYSGAVCKVMSMWRLRWHFANKSVRGAPYVSIKNYSLSHGRTLWWRVGWLKQCRLEVAAELQQRWRRTNRRSTEEHSTRSSSSHREGSITQRGASCGWYDQRRRRSTPKTPTWTYTLLVVMTPILKFSFCSIESHRLDVIYECHP